MLKGLDRYILSNNTEDEMLDAEDDLFNMEVDDDINAECVVTGKVGGWTGVHEIEPQHFDNAVDCFRSLIYTRYEHTYTLKRTGRWTFRFTEAHHDDPFGRTQLKITIKH